jgi:hypothetical protein
MKYTVNQSKQLSDYFHSFNSENIQYYESIKKHFSLTEKVSGDIVEFGVGRGRSLIALCYLINELKNKTKLTKNVYAFDSFQGFSYITDKDKSSRNPKEGEWSKSPNENIKYSPKFIKTVLGLHIDESNFKDVKLVKGFVEKIIPQYINKIKTISFINCDVDLYSGHKVILETCWEKLSKNGVIYFDDVYPKKTKKMSLCYENDFPGARKAYDEFFKDKKRFCEEHVCSFRGNVIVQKIK